MLLGVCFPVGPSFHRRPEARIRKSLVDEGRGKGPFLRNPHKGDKRGILPPPIVLYTMTKTPITNSSNRSVGVMGLAL